MEPSPKSRPVRSRIDLLFNPKAGSAALFAALRERLADVRFVESHDPDDLRRRAVEAARAGGDLLAVAGGDGTIHAVVNALGPDFPATPLGILPLGTGNDLCRTLAVPLDPPAAADLFATGEARALDVIRLGGEVSGFAINAVTGGFSGRVSAGVTSHLKEAWGPLAYLRGAVESVTDPPRFRLKVRYDGGPPEVVEAVNVVVANGRTAAGGFLVAPGANPEDGLLDVVIVRSTDILDLSIVAAALMEGDYLSGENVLHRRAKRVELESDPPLPVSLDGELAEGSRFVFEAVPRAVRFVVGPDYVAAPEPPPSDQNDDEPNDTRPRTTGQRLFGLASAVLRLGGRLTRVYAAGLWVSLAVVAAFVWLASGVLAHEFDALNDSARRDAAAARTPALDVLAFTLTRIGDILVMILIGGALVFWYVTRRRYLDAITLVALMSGSGLLEAVLKALFGVARPDVNGHLVEASWYSFPSGHALRGVTLYVGVAVLLVTRHPHSAWRWVAALGLCGLAFGICWSRLYLGVHWLTDLVGGSLAAIGWVTACLLARHYATQRFAPPPATAA